MNPILAEFIGTAMPVIFGNGVVANVLLTRTKGQNSGQPAGGLAALAVGPSPGLLSPWR